MYKTVSSANIHVGKCCALGDGCSPSQDEFQPVQRGCTTTTERIFLFYPYFLPCRKFLSKNSVAKVRSTAAQHSGSQCTNRSVASTVYVTYSVKKAL